MNQPFFCEPLFPKMSRVILGIEIFCQRTNQPVLKCCSHLPGRFWISCCFERKLGHGLHSTPREGLDWWIDKKCLNLCVLYLRSEILTLAANAIVAFWRKISKANQVPLQSSFINENAKYVQYNILFSQSTTIFVSHINFGIRLAYFFNPVVIDCLLLLLLYHHTCVENSGVLISIAFCLFALFISLLIPVYLLTYYVSTLAIQLVKTLLTFGTFGSILWMWNYQEHSIFFVSSM